MRNQTAISLILLLSTGLTGGSVAGAELTLKKPVRTPDAIQIPTPGSAGTYKRADQVRSPGIVLDSTYYDWQANGGFDDHLVMFDDGGTVRIHAVWTTAHNEDLSDRCQAVYNCWSGTSRGENSAGSCMYPPPSGHGSLSVLDNGSLVVCSNAQIDSIGGAIASVDAFPCIHAFSHYMPPSDPTGLWPRITVNADNSIVMTGVSIEAFNGVSHGVMWTYDFDQWHHFSAIAPNWMDDDMEWPTIHSGTNGKVGVVIPDMGGAIRLFESTDNGISFDSLTIAIADTSDLPSGLDSTAARLGWINSDITYIGDEPHVVWSAAQGARVGGESGLFDFKSTIFHWSPSTGIDTVVVASTQSANSSRDDYVPTPFNHLSVDWPSIGLASDGHELVVVFTAMNPDDIDLSAGLGYVDIWVTTSPNKGETWYAPQNITNPDGSVLGWDDRYPSVAKDNFDNAADPGHDAYMIYQSDDLAGTLVQGTEAYTNIDYIKFLGFDFEGGYGIGDDESYGADLPRVAALSQNCPNPFNPSTTITYDVTRRSHVSISVFDVRGRLVRTLVDAGRDTGSYSVEWNGRDTSNLQVPSGVYLYVMRSDDSFESKRKMLLLK